MIHQILAVPILMSALSHENAHATTKLTIMANAFPGASKLGVASVVTDITTVTNDDTEQRFLLAWGYFESLWGSYNLGDCTCKTASGKKTKCPNLAERHVWNCQSFGVMQAQNPQKWISSATPSAVISDRKLGFKVGLAIFRHCMKLTNQDVRAALRMYSSGRVDRAFEKVAKRCKWIGC